MESGVEEVAVPDSVRELCDGCFRWCEQLRSMTFGPSTSLERIGIEAFGAVQENVLHAGLLKSVSPTVFVSCVMAASRGAGVCAV